MNDTYKQCRIAIGRKADRKLKSYRYFGIAVLIVFMIIALTWVIRIFITPYSFLPYAIHFYTLLFVGIVIGIFKYLGWLFAIVAYIELYLFAKRIKRHVEHADLWQV